MEPNMSPEDEPAEIQGFAKWFRTHPDKSESTAQRYRTELRKWALFCEERDIPLLDADSRDVERFFTELRDRGHSQSTVKNARAGLSQFFQREGNFGDKTPVDRADIGDWTTTSEKEQSDDSVEWLKPEQVEQLVENVPAPTFRNRLVIRLMFQTGIRPGELGTIKIGTDPDWQNNNLRYVDRINRKLKVVDKKSSNNTTTKKRKTFYQPSLDEPLRLWIETERETIHGAKESPYLFPTRQGKAMDNQAVNRVVRDAAENAGLQKTYTTTSDGRDRAAISGHVLRHSFAMNALRGRGDEEGSGMETKFVKDALGHEDIETTISEYIHDDEELLQQEWHAHGPTLEVGKK
jgi:integrase/recombinase XerD